MMSPTPDSKANDSKATLLRFENVGLVFPDGTKALAINVTATDGHSLSASETFVLSVTQAASQFGQAIAGMTSGTTSSTGSLTFTPSPQDHSTNLASPAHS